MDESGRVRLFKDKPIKCYLPACWKADGHVMDVPPVTVVINELENIVDWEDDEPVSIQWLLRACEVIE